MPPIQSISCDKNQIEVVTHKGKITFDASRIPADKDTIAKLETHLNVTFLPLAVGKKPIYQLDDKQPDGIAKDQNGQPIITGFLQDYELESHVVSLNPLVLTMYTANTGERIPANWWLG